MDHNQQNNQQQTDPAQQTQPAGTDVGNIITAQQPQQPVTISAGAGVATMTGAYTGSTTVPQPEQLTPVQQMPAQVQPLDSIIQQLQAQNAALMQQNEALNAQVVKLINGGVQVNTQQQQQQPTPVQQMPAQVQQMLSMGAQPDPLGVINPPSLADGHDWSMEGLAGEIGGKR
jgi:cell division protein FtsB